jgi:hypothetical protein
MAKDKKSFVLYTDLIHVVRKLVEKDRVEKTNNAGELLLHILEYVNDTNPIPINFTVEVVFEPVMRQMKKDLIEWEKTKQDKSKGGKKGMKNRYGENGITKEEDSPPEQIPKHLQREPLKPYVETVSEGTHAEFAKRIMLPENQLDKESIETSCKKTLTAQIIKEFNANCVNQGKEHMQYNKWRSHLANWFGKRKAEVTTTTRYKTFPDD